MAELRSTLALDYAGTRAEVLSLFDTRRAKQEEMETRRRAWAQQAKDLPEESLASLGPAPTSVLEEDGMLPTVKSMNQIYLDIDRTFYTHRNLVERHGEAVVAIVRCDLDAPHPTPVPDRGEPEGP